MRHITGCVIFEADTWQVALFHQCTIEPFDGCTRSLRRGETLRHFEDVVSAGEAARGKARCLYACCGRVTCMQRLTHRAELRLQTRGLCAGDSERERGTLRIELQQIRCGRRGAKTAERAGCMPTGCVMTRAEIAADDAFGINAGAERGEQCLRCEPMMFDECKNRRRDWHRRMSAHSHMNIVVIVGVSCCAVDQRRLFDAYAPAGADQRCL